MSANEAVKHGHGHMKWVGIVGSLAGAALMIFVPSLKPISRMLFLFAGFHLVGAVVFLSSLYVTRGRKLNFAFVRSQSSGQFDFGWPLAWTYGPWIAALVLTAAAVAFQVAAPGYWPVAMALTLLAAVSCAGGLVTRGSGQYEKAVLPAVDLVTGENKLILDAGCGAGRTTVALGRAYKKDRIVSLDRFDAEYVEGGGRALFERNLQIAGINERVRIEVGDLTAMPFADQSFDAVVSAHAIDHLGQQKEQGLREALRVLKPGGRLLLIVWVPGWAVFSVVNVLALTLSTKHAWRRMATNAGFILSDEGSFNGIWFALLKRPEA